MDFLIRVELELPKLRYVDFRLLVYFTEKQLHDYKTEKFNKYNLYSCPSVKLNLDGVFSMSYDFAKVLHSCKSVTHLGSWILNIYINDIFFSYFQNLVWDVFENSKKQSEIFELPTLRYVDFRLFVYFTEKQLHDYKTQRFNKYNLYSCPSVKLNLDGVFSMSYDFAKVLHSCKSVTHLRSWILNIYINEIFFSYFQNLVWGRYTSINSRC